MAVGGFGSRLTLAEEQTGKHASARFLLLSAALLDQAQFQGGVGMVGIELQGLAEGVYRGIGVLGPPEDAGHVKGASRRSRRPQRPVDQRGRLLLRRRRALRV